MQKYTKRESRILLNPPLAKRIPFYKPIYFELYELVWKSIYENYHSKNKDWILWRKFDNIALIVLDRLRLNCGSIVINNWYWGGNLQYSGARPFIKPPDQNWFYNTTHKDFNTFDLHSQEMTAKELYNHILDNQNQYPEITVMENIKLTPNWVHISTCNFGDNGKIRIIGG